MFWVYLNIFITLGTKCDSFFRFNLMSFKRCSILAIICFYFLFLFCRSFAFFITSYKNESRMFFRSFLTCLLAYSLSFLIPSFLPSLFLPISSFCFFIWTSFSTFFLSFSFLFSPSFSLQERRQQTLLFLIFRVLELSPFLKKITPSSFVLKDVKTRPNA